MFKRWIGFYLNVHIKALSLIETNFWASIYFLHDPQEGAQYSSDLEKLGRKKWRDFVFLNVMLDGKVVCCLHFFSNNSCVDITYSPPARYRGWAGAEDGTIQHLEYKTTNFKQRP